MPVTWVLAFVATALICRALERSRYARGFAIGYCSRKQTLRKVEPAKTSHLSLKFASWFKMAVAFCMATQCKNTTPREAAVDRLCNRLKITRPGSPGVLHGKDSAHPKNNPGQYKNWLPVVNGVVRVDSHLIGAMLKQRCDSCHHGRLWIERAPRVQKSFW